MTSRIAAFLRKSGVIPGISLSTEIDAIKMNTTTFQGGSLVSLLFLDGSDSPSFVVRVPRDRARPERLRANYQALQRLLGISSISDTVPRPVFLGEVNGTVLTVETCMHGTALYADLASRTDRTAMVIDKLFDWAWRLHSYTAVGPVPGYADSVTSNLRLLRETGLISTESEAILSNWVDYAVESGISFAFRHGDFNPNNVLIAEDGEPSGVVDWEYAGIGPAVFDIFTMLRTGLLAAESEAGRITEQVESLLGGTHPESKQLLGALSRYSSENNYRPLLYVYLVQMLAEFVNTTGNRRDPQLRPWVDYINGLTAWRPSASWRRSGPVAVC